MPQIVRQVTRYRCYGRDWKRHCQQVDAPPPTTNTHSTTTTSSSSCCLPRCTSPLLTDSITSAREQLFWRSGAWQSVCLSHTPLAVAFTCRAVSNWSPPTLPPPPPAHPRRLRPFNTLSGDRNTKPFSDVRNTAFSDERVENCKDSGYVIKRNGRYLS